MHIYIYIYTYIYIYISDTDNEGPIHPDLAEAHGLANDGFLVSQPKEAQRSTRAVMASHGQSSGCDPPLLVDEWVRGLHILANILVIEVSLSIDWWYDIQLIINIDYTTQYIRDFNNPIEGSWKTDQYNGMRDGLWTLLRCDQMGQVCCFKLMKEIESDYPLVNVYKTMEITTFYG